MAVCGICSSCFVVIVVFCGAVVFAVGWRFLLLVGLDVGGLLIVGLTGWGVLCALICCGCGMVLWLTVWVFGFAGFGAGVLVALVVSGFFLCCCFDVSGLRCGCLEFGFSVGSCSGGFGVCWFVVWRCPGLVLRVFCCVVVFGICGFGVGRLIWLVG